MTTSKEEQVQEVSLDQLTKAAKVVTNKVDNMTSAKLKRVVKIFAHCHIANYEITGEVVEISDDEKELLDDVFNCVETVMGYTQMNTELKGDGNE